MSKSQLTAAQQFGLRLAQERRHKAFLDARDLGQKDVAKAVGVSESTLSRWEAGETMPREEAMLKLARYFKVTPAWLRYGTEPREAGPRPQLAADTRRADKRDVG